MKKGSQNEPREYLAAGVYEHYKSTPESLRYYQVIGIAKHTETEEKMVVYIPLYVIPDHTGPRLQVRPLSMFQEALEYKGRVVPRFKYLGSELA